MDLLDEIRRILGGKTPGQFIKLPMEERDKVFQHHLVQKDYVRIEKEDNDDFLIKRSRTGRYYRRNTLSARMRRGSSG
jgi:hypothetical protein